MSFSFETQNDMLLIKLIGEVDLYQAPELRAKIPELMGEVPGVEFSRHILVDMSELEYLDSSGIGVLVQLKNESARHFIKIAFMKPQNHIRKLLSMSNLIKFFTVFDTDSEAIEYLQN